MIQNVFFLYFFLSLGNRSGPSLMDIWDGPLHGRLSVRKTSTSLRTCVGPAGERPARHLDCSVILANELRFQCLNANERKFRLRGWLRRLSSQHDVINDVIATPSTEPFSRVPILTGRHPLNYPTNHQHYIFAWLATGESTISPLFGWDALFCTALTQQFWSRNCSWLNCLEYIA